MKRADTKIWKVTYPERPKGMPWAVTWFMDVPWAHPAWRQYALMLYDLTSKHPTGEPIIYLKGATHEMLLGALSPDTHYNPDVKPKEPYNFLTPMNHGYQFIAESNEAAEARIQALVDRIEAGTLSPDTDFRYMWDQEFTDGDTLHMKGTRNAH